MSDLYDQQHQKAIYFLFFHKRAILVKFRLQIVRMVRVKVIIIL